MALFGVGGGAEGSDFSKKNFLRHIFFERKELHLEMDLKYKPKSKITKMCSLMRITKYLRCAEIVSLQINAKVVVSIS